MSRIWQALRQAERERDEVDSAGHQAEADDDESARRASSERRKGLRHSHRATLLVYGSDADKQPFHEECDTIDANENGCLLFLSSEIARGQRLFLTNMHNQAEQECRVVYVGRRTKGKIRVGVEFLKPTPEFWRRAR